MLENRDHWEDVGHEVERGDFVKGSRTIILRPDENSPLSLSKHESKEEIVKYFAAPTIENEVDWVISQIKGFVSDGLKPEDILVVSLDDRNARRYFDTIRSGLLKSRIGRHNILDNPYSSSRFALDGLVTLSTVHRAKGNESAAVIAIGIDAL